MLATRLLERFLEDAAGSLTLRCVEDPALAEPERDVVRLSGWPEADEVASAELALVDRLRGGLLLVRVPRYEAAEPAVGHVHEPGAVDPALGHPSPLVGHAEVQACFLDRIALCPAEPVALRRSAQRLDSHPARVVVGRPDAGPVAVRLLNGERLAAQGLGHLLRFVVGLRAHGRDVERADAGFHYAGRMRGSRRA